MHVFEAGEKSVYIYTQYCFDTSQHVHGMWCLQPFDTWGMWTGDIICLWMKHFVNLFNPSVNSGRKWVFMAEVSVKIIKLVIDSAAAVDDICLKMVMASEMGCHGWHVSYVFHEGLRQCLQIGRLGQSFSVFKTGHRVWFNYWGIMLGFDCQVSMCFIWRSFWSCSLRHSVYSDEGIWGARVTFKGYLVPVSTFSHCFANCCVAITWPR